MRKLGNQPRGLIETLHSVQESFGYLDDSALRYVAHSLRVPLSRAYGVATFYHFFTLKPPGKHTCVICLGTACHIKGAPQLLTATEGQLEIGDGETTPDGNVSLVTAHCIGSCVLAPVAVLDGEIVGKVTSDQLHNSVAQWVSHES
jgi:bidirectional [NiFe] hydrogenase diaphorase subunit